MSHSYTQIFYHLVWSTKKRMPFFSQAGKKRVYGYIKTFLYKKDIELCAIGGTHDHIHMLVKTNGDVLIRNLIRDIKSSSSRFINEAGNGDFYFAWQKGYGALSVSLAMVNRVTRYIHNQEEHHKDLRYEEELKLILQL